MSPALFSRAVLVEGVGPGGKGKLLPVLRQLLYFSDKCVFLLAKVSSLLLTVCKVVVFSTAGQSVVRTPMTSSAGCLCHTPCVCSLTVKAVPCLGSWSFVFLSLEEKLALDSCFVRPGQGG